MYFNRYLAGIQGTQFFPSLGPGVIWCFLNIRKPFKENHYKTTITLQRLHSTAQHRGITFKKTRVINSMCDNVIKQNSQKLHFYS